MRMMIWEWLGSALLLVFALLIPGLPWTFLFWPRGLDWYERLTLAIAFSFVIPPLLMWLANRTFGWPLTRWSVIGLVTGAAGLALAIRYWPRKKRNVQMS